ncbi:MAG: NUDIX domain-containing protein [Paracoccaceae bacterium]|nr:NUDIX domain-containing protein [Paracoccaceae bacterium]
MHYFFYGTLCHVPLLERVLGRPVVPMLATLAGHDLRQACARSGAGAEDLAFPLLVPGAGRVEGLLVDVTPAEVLRLDYYEAGHATTACAVTTPDGAERSARVYLAESGRWLPGDLWDLRVWAARWGDVVTEAAVEFMAGLDHLPPERALSRYPMMLVRAASRLRARAATRPAQRRRVPVPGDVEITRMVPAYARFFAVEEYHLRHRTFAGGMSPVLERAAFISGDATVVLPYDPLRDRVLLVEQFRAGPLARGDANPWSLEAIAGRVDAGETPQEAARREAVEEAGVTLTDLIPAPNFYPSPGAKTEFLYCYLALADLPDDAARPGGLEEEGEDIRPHLIAFSELMALIDSGEVENAPLLVLALWLERMRPRLRAAADAGTDTRL